MQRADSSAFSMPTFFGRADRTVLQTGGGAADVIRKAEESVSPPVYDKDTLISKAEYTPLSFFAEKWPRKLTPAESINLPGQKIYNFLSFLFAVTYLCIVLLRSADEAQECFNLPRMTSLVKSYGIFILLLFIYKPEYSRTATPLPSRHLDNAAANTRVQLATC